MVPLVTQSDRLSELVREANDRGLSYRAMAHRAEKAGYKISSAYLNNLASNPPAKAPTAQDILAIAAALGRNPVIIRLAVAEQWLELMPEDVSREANQLGIIAPIPPDLPEDERAELSRLIEAWVEARKSR